MKLSLSFFKNNIFVIMAVTILGMLITFSLMAPLIAPFDPAAVDIENRLAPAGGDHIWGTDHLGRDFFSRIVHGTSYSMGASLLTLLFIALIGISIGSFSALMGGWVDKVLMRICDVFMTFPTVVLALFMIAVLGSGLLNVIIAIALTHWAWYARIVRGMVLSLQTSPYILAARVGGLSLGQRFVRHILPSVLVQIAVLATLDIGHIMLHVAGLSFLGVGVQPPAPEWGVMINDARQYIFTQPYLIIVPGLAILLSVMSFNILGDYLRDKLDPALEGH